MADAVFIDTNKIRNPDGNKFFGNTDELQQLSRVAEIHVPSIVIEEIKWQKRRQLRKKLSSFKDNYFFKMVTCDAEALEAHVETEIERLFDEAGQELEFTASFLNEDATHLSQLQDLALRNKAPFSPKDDKGFKDACIYLTILQHLDSDPNEQVFLITDDGLLKQAFHNAERVTVIRNSEDYFDCSGKFAIEPYFLERLSDFYHEEFPEQAKPIFNPEDIGDCKINTEDEWELAVKSDNFDFGAVIDFYSHEVIRFENI